LQMRSSIDEGFGHFLDTKICHFYPPLPLQGGDAKAQRRKDAK
jgi:hypothetical protein